MTPIFFSLVRAIISQQLSEAAASTIFNRLSSITEITPDTLSSLDVAAFRSCGISFRKAEYIKGIAEAALAGEIQHIADLSDDGVVNVLTDFAFSLHCVAGYYMSGNGLLFN